jgi:hypothetical protein
MRVASECPACSHSAAPRPVLGWEGWDLKQPRPCHTVTDKPADLGGARMLWLDAGDLG